MIPELPHPEKSHSWTSADSGQDSRPSSFEYRCPMDDDRVAAALADIGEDGPDIVTLASGVYEWIAGEEGIDSITLAGVQRFAWYDLSAKWLIEDSERMDVLAAGAALFDALGLERYASVLRSPQTAEIMTAHERSYDEGLKAYQKAFEASGISPPDVEDLEWGSVMAIEENAAQQTIGMALEQAMDDGRMVPGSRGWRTTAKAITTEVLDSAHPEIPGQSWRSVILTERTHNWLRKLEHRSHELHTLMAGKVNRLLSPVQPPSNLDSHLGPITWFLDYVGDGVKMTGAGFLPTAMVRDGADRFGWDKGWSDDSPKKESDSRELMTLHQLLLDAGAVRHRKGDITRTTIGSAMVEDPEYAWRTIAASLTPYEWLASVAQIYTLLLLDGESDEEVLWGRALPILIEIGYRAGDDPPDQWTVKSAWRHVSHPLMVLDGLVQSGRYLSRKITMTPFGEATLLERLRLEATGPMRYP